ncbi:RagB/SusD family nutrient uptake outer membrane protein [Parapedobacter koreensis]|nr:RagB/SusD family nutrient uptake outer membrane protein [Parapedobacter koreensis]
MKGLYRLTVVALMLGFSMSCSDNYLEENPPHLITSETLFTSYSGFEAGLNGLYALVRHEREGLAGSSSMTTELFMNGTDNIVTNHVVGSFNNVAMFWETENNSLVGFYNDGFSWLYKVVNTANTLIVQAEKEGVDWEGGGHSADENKQLLLANARAARAWAYRHLVFGWGDVPLNLEETNGTTIKTDWSRTPMAEVRRQMIADWRFAEQYVPVEPIPGQISKGAVQHYLAETYLVLNNLDSALYWVDQVVNTPNYKLVTERYGVDADKPGVPFMDMFKGGNTNREEGNTEALWVFQFEPRTVGGGSNPIERRHHISRFSSININGVSPLILTEERGYGLGRMSLTKWAIENYEPQDDRGSEYAIRKFFILQDAAQNAPFPADRLPEGYQYGDTIWLDWSSDISFEARGRTNWPYSRKVEWKDPTNVQNDYSFKDAIYLRLAETYLLRAEILYRLNRTSEAVDVLNSIRRRAHASEIDENDVDIDFILDERSRELVLEEHRRYTLLRTGKWLERTRRYNHNGGQRIVERDTLFPIPQVVIDANLTSPMTQNQGYN